MPKMQKTQKQISPVLQGTRPLPSAGLERLMRREGQVRRQMGATLQSLGKGFAELALRVQRMHNREELADAQLRYEEGKNIFLTQQEQAANYASWAEDTAQMHDKLVTTETANIKSPSARKDFEHWARAAKSTLLFTTATRADRLASEKARSMLRIRMENAVKNGTILDFKDHLGSMAEDELLVPEEVEFWSNEVDELSDRWVHQQALQGVRATARQISRDAGPDAAYSYVKEAVKAEIFDATDEKALLNLIEYFKDVDEKEAEDARLLRKKTETTEYLGLLRQNKLDPTRIEESEHGVTHQSTWKGYLRNSMRKAPELDLRKYLGLEDQLFDSWGIDKTAYEMSMAEARYGKERYITDNELDTLQARLGMDMPRQYLGNLRTGFETIRRAGNKWSRGIRAMSQEEAKAVAQARQALIDWLWDDRVAKKKETSPTEFYARSIALAALYRPGAPPPRLTQLESVEQWLSTQTKPKDLITDLRNAMKAVQEGRDPYIIFQRVFDTYKGRKELQPFLEQVIKPLTKGSR